jgi:hypothetical protein
VQALEGYLAEKDLEVSDGAIEDTGVLSLEDTDSISSLPTFKL